MIDIQKTILVTGGNGFVGANLLHTLVSLGAKNIHIILRESSDTWRLDSILSKLHVHHISLSDEKSLDFLIEKIQPKIVYHLAAAGAYIGRDGSGIDGLFQTNVLGTIHLLNSCKNVGFEYFINTGSNSEYGEKDHAMKEDDILEPNNEYGVTKASASLYCSFVGKKEQLPVYTFRLFAVYGYFEDKSRLIPSIMMSYIAGSAPSLSRPTSVRDFVFIEDVVAYYLHIDSITGDFGGVFNIGSGSQQSIGEVVEMVQKCVDSKIAPAYGTQTLRQKEPSLWLADMTKTNGVFSTVKQTSLEEGFSKTYQWFENNLAYYSL